MSNRRDNATVDTMNDPPAEHSETWQVVVSASFTAQPIEPAIDFWAHELSLPIDLTFAPYDQIFQQLLGPETVMAKNSSGLNVFLLRLEDLARTTPTQQPTAGAATPTWSDIRRAATELAGQMREAASRWSVPVLVLVCPPSPSIRQQERFVHDVETEFLQALRGTPALDAIGSADLEACYPGSSATDPYADQLGHVPYTTPAFAGIATTIVRRLYRIRTPEPKVVVVDADNTLWDGVAGEGDVADIDIGTARQAIQELLLQQRSAGRLLCLCSRNTEADTIEVIGLHQGMRLGVEDFTAVRVNWGPKSENLRDLAAELGLGLDSFVFVDDSPVECAEVRERCPDVVVLQPPADATAAERYLRHCWILDIGNTTQEDSQRTAYYRTEREREQARRATPSLADFLESLRLRIEIDRADTTDVARIAQLTQRTNQFNLNTNKRTDIDVRELVTTGECLVVTAEDRFGPYGTVGVVVLGAAGAALRVETLLLSCRALGRGIEHRILAHVGRLADACGLDNVELVYRKTARNQPATDFLRQVCGIAEHDGLDDGVLALPTTVAAAASYVPPTGSGEHGGPVGTASNTGETRHTATLGRALWLSADRTYPELPTAEQIDERIRARLGVPPAAGPDRFRGDPASVADAVGAIMAEVLGVDSIGPDENFFELGGTSVQLVQFMSAVSARLGVELPMDTLYNSELTARDVGSSILLRAMGEPGDVSKALAVVESMTDAQVEAMLSALEPSTGRYAD